MSAATPERCVNAIRCLSADMPSAAKSGHPGAPMGCAPMAYSLYHDVMNYNPTNPKWSNRDRFVLSNGHGCALQYAMLHLTGFKVSLDDLKKFRQVDSITPGHPEVGITDGVEVTTGPLGQGFANAVGLAIAEEHLRATYNKPGFDVVDHYTYAIMGDGCNQEGVSTEAASLAGHLQLGRLIVLYDDNKITIDGETDLSFTEDVGKRYEAYGWHVMTVADGDSDPAAITKAIEEAKKVTNKPSLIKVKTIIGFGSKEQGTHGVHGAPLKADDLSALKTKFGFDGSKSFDIPEDVLGEFRKSITAGQAKEDAWNAMFEKYSGAHPKLAAEFKRRMSGELPADWKAVLPTYKPSDKAIATRKLHGVCLNKLAEIMPEIIGGSADLTPSNNTALACTHDFQAATRDGRYLRFGVREHGMAAICNGLCAYGGFIPFGATFLNFIEYAAGAVRLSALSHLRVLYIMTHDSIGLGEDGPTHQPIEALSFTRAMPNILTLRPCDGNEVSGTYAVAIENNKRPSVLALTRQDLPHLEGTSMEGVYKGGYVLNPDVKDPQLVFVASGSEVSLCVDAAKALNNLKVRIVSMPCMELFAEQTPEYRISVLGEGVPVMSVEAASVTGWSSYAHVSHGMTTFGASGPYKDVYRKFGFTPEAIASKALALVDFYKNRPVPSFERPSF